MQGVQLKSQHCRKKSKKKKKKIKRGEVFFARNKNTCITPVLTCA